MMIFGITAALALGVFLAITLRRSQRRLRNPDQATNELGLTILGTVPVISTDARHAEDQAAQLVEAFRNIRTNVRNAIGPTRPLTITITSAGKKDGKSLIASNLALSFAESGARTLLIDADLRHGELTQTFGVNSRPGLIEYLDDNARIDDVLHSTTSHKNLTVLPTGAIRPRASELLASPRLPQLIGAMARKYETVIVDSPPLGAGVDSYALATATGTAALVLRANITDRKMANARLDVLATLPVRVIGAVLNGFTPASSARSDQR